MISKLTIEEMHKIASERGGTCLSKKYIDVFTKLEWMCAEGHTWEATPTRIKHRKKWCPNCTGSIPLTIKDMQKVAKERGGKCLSVKYINSKENLRWMCSEGHTWDATSDNVRNRKTWCPTCPKSHHLTIEWFQKTAIKRGGKCLSEKYTNQKTKLRWMCAEGHTWEATPGSIRNNGNWCPDCAGQSPTTIEEMQKIASERGGKCLSEKCINSKDKLRWMCAEGHTWEAKPSHVKNSNSWCPTCSGNATLTIEEMHKIAADRSGKCLSTEYINEKTKLEWMCSEGHTWKAVPSQVRGRGSWCHQCNWFYKEEICRTTFEQIFEIKFPKCKPVWLTTPTGSRLELDGYCEELEIAFEYNGEQHYKKNVFAKLNSALEEIKYRDNLKYKLCEKHGVQLFIITYENDLNDLSKLIESKIDSTCLGIGDIDFAKTIDFNRVYQSRNRLLNLQEIAKARGGKCLSDKYIDVFTKLIWVCAEGHTWEAPAHSVKNKKSWCPNCAGHAPLTIEEMHKIAAERDGKCLSNVFVGRDKKLKWMCAEGHTWEAKPFSVKYRKSWCPLCRIESKNKKNLFYMEKIATERGGKCLSEKYINNKEELIWMCAEGHTWEATPKTVKQSKTWCVVCSMN